jgi:hypothetical protein
MKLQIILFAAFFVLSLVIVGIVVRPVLINNDNDLRIRMNNIANAEVEDRITSEMTSELTAIAEKTNDPEIAGIAFFNAGKLFLLEYKNEKEISKPSRTKLDYAITNFERSAEVCIKFANPDLCGPKLKEEIQTHLDYARSLFEEVTDKKSASSFKKSVDNAKAQSVEDSGMEKENLENMNRAPIDSSVRGSKSDDHEPSDDDDRGSNPGGGYSERPIRP